MSSRSFARRAETSLRVVVFAANVAFSDRVLRCLSVTAVTLSTATELGAPWGEAPPDAVIVFADGYPSDQVIDFVHERLRASRISRIALVSEDPHEFQSLGDSEDAAQRLSFFSLSVWGWNVLDAVISLSARLSLDARRN